MGLHQEMVLPLALYVHQISAPAAGDQQSLFDMRPCVTPLLPYLEWRV